MASRLWFVGLFGLTLLGPHTLAVAQTCPTGFVWREAFPGDHVCVTPAQRTQAASDNAQANARREPGPGAFGPDTCRQGFVWRGAFPGDRVCVTPATRDQVAKDNILGDSRVTPLTVGPNGPPACKTGFVWRLAGPKDFTCVTPQQHSQAESDNALAADRRGNDACKQGFVWREASPSDFVCVTPATRAQVHLDNEQAEARWRLHQVCTEYADDAVRQQAINLDTQGGGCPHQGDRWSSNRDGHYNWCLSAAEDIRAFEDAIRRAEVRACVNTVCLTYANKAQSDTQRVRSCGGPSGSGYGTDWSNRFEDYFEWCVRKDSAERARAAAVRTAALERCPRSTSPVTPGEPGCCWTGSASGPVHQCGPVCPCGIGNC